MLSEDSIEVSGIAEPTFGVQAIDRLVMKSPTNKTVIKALCKAYTSSDGQHKPFYADNIEGKGEGQIILLHGPPGTGKTLTAGTPIFSTEPHVYH
jgi:Cdc6-like AAA superfamily ATPase